MQTANRHIHDAQRRIGKVAVLVLVLSVVSGCITAPPKKKTAVEKAREESAVGAELEHQFDSKLRYRHDPVVDRYLNDLAHHLSAPSNDARLVDASVVVIQDRGGQWRTYSLPGRKVYLSLGLLQRFKFDNEVAAAIALEFGTLVQSHALNHLKKQVSAPAGVSDVETPPHVKFFNREGIFDFDIEEVKASVKSGIDILYKAGFDVRGMSQIWSLLEANPEHSPFSPAVLEELSIFTRSVISRYAPLRNPIVRTLEFQSVQKRIMKL